MYLIGTRSLPLDKLLGRLRDDRIGERRSIAVLVELTLGRRLSVDDSSITFFGEDAKLPNVTTPDHHDTQKIVKQGEQRTSHLFGELI